MLNSKLRTMFGGVYFDLAALLFPSRIDVLAFYIMLKPKDWMTF